MLDDGEDGGVRLWHLVKASEESELPKHRRGSVRERGGERAKAIPEIYLTRLLSMKVQSSSRCPGLMLLSHWFIPYGHSQHPNTSCSDLDPLDAQILLTHIILERLVLKRNRLFSSHILKHHALCSPEWVQ